MQDTNDLWRHLGTAIINHIGCSASPVGKRKLDWYGILLQGLHLGDAYREFESFRPSLGQV